MGRAAKATLMMAALLAGSERAEAQRRGAPGGSLGVSFVAASALGELGAVVDNGFGFELAVGAPMTEEGHLRLRGDLGVLVYGIERLRYCSFACRFASELTTTNGIVYGGIGPELIFAPGAPIQPYVHGSAGLSYFVTSSSLNDNDGYGPYLQTTNYSDVVFAWRYGGGLRLRVGHRRPVYLDLGVDRHENGIADYLTAGDIVDNPDGSVTIYPNRSEADLMSFRFGLSFGVH